MTPDTITTELQTYAAQGHTLLRGLMSPEVAAGMTYQFQALVKQVGPKILAAPRVGVKPAWEVYGYHWSPMMTFLWAMTPRIEAVAGVPLLPTYAFFRTYQQSDICKVHADRAACEHSLSLTLGYADNQPWALSVEEEKLPPEKQLVQFYVEDFGGKPFASHAMQAGDGVLYKGIEHRHARLEPNPNRWSAHLFLHWVEKGGKYANMAFDGQSVSAPGEFEFPASTHAAP